MSKGKVLNFSKYRILEFLKNNLYTLIGFVFLTIGIILGLVLFDEFDYLTEFLNGYFSDYISFRNSGGFLKIIFNTYFKSLYLFLIIYVCGTTLFGVVLVPAFITFLGLFYGSSIAYLYSVFALRGVAFNAMIFLPSSLVLIILLIFASRTAMLFSLQIAKLTLPNSFSGNLVYQFKEYSLKILLISFGGLIVGSLDGLTAISLLKFFEF